LTDPDETTGKTAPEKEGRNVRQSEHGKASPGGKEALPKPQDPKQKGPSPDEIVSLKEQLRQEQEKSREYLNKLLYAQADFENYRKRFSQEVESRIEAGKAKLIQNLLAIADELELGLNAARNTENAEAVTGGLEMVLKKFRDLLAAEGLTPIESVGKKFDPTLHEAVQSVETPDTDEGTIVEEVRRGFTLKGKLMRPSIVKISVHQIAKSENKEGQGEMN
jgi:molecular chaperone GrpE